MHPPLILIMALALASLAQVPARAELVRDTEVWRSLPQTSYRQSGVVRPWYRGHDVATIRCDTAALGAQVGSVRSSTLGIHLGNPFDRNLDAVDRACLGHALEWAPERRSVRWKNQRSGVEYDIVPLRREDHNGLQCRFFEGSLMRDRQRTPWRGKACRAADGIWRVA